MDKKNKQQVCFCIAYPNLDGVENRVQNRMTKDKLYKTMVELSSKAGDKNVLHSWRKVPEEMLTPSIKSVLEEKTDYGKEEEEDKGGLKEFIEDLILEVVGGLEDNYLEAIHDNIQTMQEDIVWIKDRLQKSNMGADVVVVKNGGSKVNGNVVKNGGSKVNGNVVKNGIKNNGVVKKNTQEKNNGEDNCTR